MLGRPNNAAIWPAVIKAKANVYHEIAFSPSGT
jgi:hypothetical protein